MLGGKKSKLVFLLVLLFLIFRAGFILALEINYPTLPFPGVDPPQVFLEKIKNGEIPAGQTLPLYVKYFYLLFLVISGMIAFLAIVYGGFLYLFSTGSPGKMMVARDQISSGILGLVILFSSYLILTTINPQLAILSVEEPKKSFGVHLYLETGYGGRFKTVQGNIANLESYLGFAPMSLKFFSLEFEGGRWVEKEWEPGETKIEGLLATIYPEINYKGEPRSYSKNTSVFDFAPKSITLGFKSPASPEEKPIKYLEIPLGWLIERTKAKAQVARDQAEDVWYIGAEHSSFHTSHASLQELAQCLELLTQQCKCDMLTEDCSGQPGASGCPTGTCKEPCNRCVAAGICAEIDSPSLANLCVGIPNIGDSLVSCETGECNLRRVIDKKQAQLDLLTSQLLQKRSDAEIARIALQKEQRTLDLAETLMRISRHPPVSYYELWSTKEKKEIEKLESWEKTEPVPISSSPPRESSPPPHSCRTNLPDYEITPSCAPCPCYPNEGCRSILFCYGKVHLGSDPPCTTDEVISDNDGWISSGQFPEGIVHYNGGTFAVPNGGVYVCGGINYCCTDPRCEQQGGAPGLGVPPRDPDDAATFYIKEEGNEDFISAIGQSLAIIWGRGTGIRPTPGVPGVFCANFNQYLSNWQGNRGNLTSQAWQAIEDVSTATGVRQALILALINHESGFNQFAGSTNSYCCGSCPPAEGSLGCQGGLCGNCSPYCLGDPYGSCQDFSELWQVFNSPDNRSWESNYGFVTEANVPFSLCGTYLGVPHCGGAMGLAQAMPFSWKSIWSAVWSEKDPWNLQHAYRFAALHLKTRGGADAKTCSAEKESVWRYVGASPEHASCIVQLANHIAATETALGEGPCEVILPSGGHIGVNAIGLPHMRFDTQDTQLNAARDMGAKVIRIFGAYNNADYATVADRVETLANKANSRGMTLIISLIDFYENNYHPQGVESYYSTDKNGWEVLNHNFFKDGYKGGYLSWVKTIVNKLKGNPGVYAWELGNEIKDITFDDSDPETFINFAADVVATIRSTGDTHPITPGIARALDAFINKEQASRFYANFDFVGVHIYEGVTRVDLDLDFEIANKQGKPILATEASFSGNDRGSKVEGDLNNWFSRSGATGYYQWGFMATGQDDIGYGDHTYGMDEIWHNDWDALYGIYCRWSGTGTCP